MRPRTRQALPTVEPIVVVAGSPPLHDPRWIYEPKFDGFRGLLYVCRGECPSVCGRRSSRSRGESGSRGRFTAGATPGRDQPLYAGGKLGAVLLQYSRWFRPTRASADALLKAK